MSLYKNEIIKALERAEDAIETAQHDLQGGFLLATANRCYYCIFYAMVALLYSEEIYAKTHQGIRSKFGEIFIKTNVLPPIMANYARDAFDIRQEADYDLEADIETEEEAQMVENAVHFLEMTNMYLQNWFQKSSS